MLHRFGKTNFTFLYVYPTALDALMYADGNEYACFEGRSDFIPSDECRVRYGMRNPKLIQGFHARGYIQEFARACARLSFQYNTPTAQEREIVESRKKLFVFERDKLLNSSENVFTGFVIASQDQVEPYRHFHDPLKALIGVGVDHAYLDRLLRMSFSNN